jgi:hypothetical protein
MDEDLFLSIDSLAVKTEGPAGSEEDKGKQDEVIVNQDEKQLENEKTDEVIKVPGAEEEEKKEGTPASENNDSSSTISVLANYLKEEGVFSSDLEGLDKVNSIAELKDIIAKQVAVSRFSDLSPSQIRYLESIESGIPLNEYEQLQKEVSDLESITTADIEENQELRFNIIAQDLIQSGLSKEKAVGMANRSIESGKDIEDAKESIKSLHERTVQKFKETVNSKKEEKQATLAEVKTLIDSKTSVMGDITLSKADKENIFKTMTTQVDTTPQGLPLNQFEKWRSENGIEAEFILSALYVSTDGFKNLGTIKTEVKSSAARQLEEKLRSVDKEELGASLNSGSSFKNQKGLTLQ